MKPRDLSLCLWKINPDMEYRLNQSVTPHNIIEWRSNLPQPTENELDDAWKWFSEIKYLGNYNVSLDINVNINDIDILIDEQTVNIPLTNNKAEFTLEFPEGVNSRTIKFLDNNTYGISEITVNRE
jgi:hypothetical protein